jgi:hypothetical protein
LDLVVHQLAVFHHEAFIRDTAAVPHARGGVVFADPGQIRNDADEGLHLKLRGRFGIGGDVRLCRERDRECRKDRALHINRLLRVVRLGR